MIPLDCFSLYEDAEFYDLEFATRSQELPYFRNLARQASGTVLEVACGTGRLTIPIALDGVDISGLDVSAPMLARAKKNAAATGANIEWIEQDCRAMRLKQRYGLIFSATNAMQHLLDADSACAFLRSARDHLLPNGLLVIDVFNPAISKLLKTPADRHFHKSIHRENTNPILVEVSSQYQADLQILYFELFYLQGTELVRTKSVNMRVFFPQEILALCQLNGLRVIRRHGDYDATPFTADSRKHLLICQRA